MIDFLECEVEQLDDHHISLRIGPVQVLARCPSRDLKDLEFDGGVWTQVLSQDDGLAMYAFKHEFCRDAFNRLRKVPGVGPATAMRVIDNLGGIGATNAATSGDAKRLEGIRGIGPAASAAIIGAAKKW